MVLMTIDAGPSGHNLPKQKLTGLVFAATSLSAIGGFLFGYDTGIVSGSMVYIKEQFNLTSVWQEVEVSSTILAAWIFSMAAGTLSDRFGRKKIVICASLVFVVGSVIMAAAFEKWSLLVGRFVVGAGVGFASAVVPMYIAELAPAHIRGSLVTFNFLFIVGGQLIAAIIAGGCSYLPEHMGWRFMLGIAAIPALIQFVGFLFMPESPRWLIAHGHDEEAHKVLIRLRGTKDVKAEYEAIKDSCSKSDDERNDSKQVLVQVLGDRTLRKALFVGCILQMTQQLTGINTVMYYTATIVQMAGVYDKRQAVWYAAAVDAIYVTCSAVGIYLVEKMGRRPLTLWSLLGVILGLGIIGGGFQLGIETAPELAWTSNSTMNGHCSMATNCRGCVELENCGFCFLDGNEGPQGSCLAMDDVISGLTSSSLGLCSNGTQLMSNPTIVWANDWCPSNYSWTILFGLAFYLFFYGPGIGAMPWTINSEIYPIWARSACYATTTAVTWFFNILVTLTFLTLTEAVGRAITFWIYAAFGVIGYIILYATLPETRGKSLEETSELFAKPFTMNCSNYSSSSKSRSQDRIQNELEEVVEYSLRTQTECKK